MSEKKYYSSFIIGLPLTWLELLSIKEHWRRVFTIDKISKLLADSFLISTFELLDRTELIESLDIHIGCLEFVSK